jgi:spermidine/putrescine-binding protein
VIPASILLILLVAADAISHVALWMRFRAQDEHMQQTVSDAFEKEAGAVVKVADYERTVSDLQYEIKRIRAWSKMPDEFKF